MDMANNIALAPDYYLDNFLKLTQHAITWYDDLLSEEEKIWLDSFLQLSRNEQCLLVRLYSRKGVWFRSDKLQYAEIADIPNTLVQLAQQKLIELSPSLTCQELATHLLTKPEMSAIFPQQVKNLTKDQLISQLPEERFCDFEALDFAVIKLNAGHMIDLLLTLFFANTHQDLSQFVLDDLGLHQFEQYPLSTTRRFFANRDQIDRLLELGQLSDRYWRCDRKQKINLDQLVASLPPAAEHPYVDRKRQHLINDIARDYERLSEFELALSLYAQTTLPPSRERRARIYDKQEQNCQFSQMIAEMLAHPADVSELEVAQKLKQRLQRKQGLKMARVDKPDCHEQHIELDLSQQRVEIATKSYFESLGWSVYYTENALLNGLLGLALWEAIFAPIEGAFINAYQYRPLDLYHADFVSKREPMIANTLEAIRSGDTETILTTYRAKQGISNPFVHWAALDETLIQLALSHIPHGMLAGLFEVQLSDLKLYRNGMPDLIAFKDGRFTWIEVKGPGDKLQDNQWRWIDHFHRLGAPFSVCYVKDIR